MVANILAPTQAQLSAAWGELGATLGTPHEWYVPNGSNNPVSGETNQGVSFYSLFDRDSSFPQTKPAEYGKPEYFCAYTRAGPNVGDYLVDQSDGTTWFIIDQEALTPSKVVKCNATVDFFRPGTPAPSNPSVKNYSRASPQGDGLPIAQQWPISLLSGSRGEKSLSGVPEAGREPWFNVLIPIIPGVRLRTDDKFVDEAGFRYQISACELTNLGYRGTARLDEG